MTLAIATVWFAAFIVGIFDGSHFGDSSLAAVIAAVASLLNGLILLRARNVQNQIHSDIQQVATDTEQRREQIGELRSLSQERNRQIQRMERLADRFDSVDLDGLRTTVRQLATPRVGGRRIYDPSHDTPPGGY